MLSLTRCSSISRLITPISKGFCLRKANISSSAILMAGADPMHQVGPWPRTKEERDRAARKYNLIPEDYEPHDYDDALGDYPKLKPVGAFNRDPYDDFDDIQAHRYHGEVYHVDADLYSWERIDPLAAEKNNVSIWLQLAIFIGLIVSLPTIHWLMHRYKITINHPVKQRSPFPGRVMYEFPRSEATH